MLPGRRHFSENNNSSGLFDSLGIPNSPHFPPSPGHDTDITWSFVHHTIFDKILLAFGLSNHCWGIAWHFRWLIKYLYRKRRRLILLKDFQSFWPAVLSAGSRARMFKRKHSFPYFKMTWRHSFSPNDHPKTSGIGLRTSGIGLRKTNGGLECRCKTLEDWAKSEIAGS